MSLRTKTLPALLGSRGEVIDPPLPATTGGWFAKSTDVLRADTAHIDQSLKNFKARTAQTRAMTDLIESRIGLARVMTDLSTLAEICATHFLKGRRQRASDLATHGLRCQLQETDARIALSLAQRHLATWPAPGSEPKPPSREPKGLTPEQVDELVGMLPEVSGTTRDTLRQLLKARLEENGS